MTPLDTLKAGIKTAVITFAATVVALVVGLLAALADWAQDGPAPDVGHLRGLIVAAVLALAAGVLNTIARYVQVAGVPFLAKLVDRLLGAVPTYPEATTTKAIVADRPLHQVTRTSDGTTTSVTMRGN